MDLKTLQSVIDMAHDQVEQGGELSLEAKQAVKSVLELLDIGHVRVCEYENGVWTTHAWLKRAILLFFKISPMVESEAGPLRFFDKIPLKTNFQDQKVRVVPPAVARYGSFMEPGVVLMPSYVNIGAYIGAQSMVDTWATVGSCAQIGKQVHLSGGVGIGGVLEPPGAMPVVIEDGAFVGSRCIIVEGVQVKREAVLAANVTLTASTPIVDTRTQPFKILKGVIPERAVVVPGTREKEVEGGKIHLNCAYIVGERSESTDRKVSLNQALRDFAVSV